MRNADLGALPAVHLFRLMESWHNPVQRLPNAGGIILLQGLLENLQLLSQLTGSNRRLPQAVISIVPTFMQMMGMCMAGSAIVENIFSLPGLGYRIVDSLTNRDLPVIYATVLFLAFALVIFNILADIIQRLLQTRKGGAA